MNCPACKTKLNRVSYEETRIHACSQCRGNLVSNTRLKTINSRRDKTQDDLLAEVVDQAADTSAKLRCPQCLSAMEKRLKPFGSEEFHIDRCKRCELTWLDAGELAKLQVLFEFSDKGLESQRFRERLENMTDEEKQDFADRVAKMHFDRSMRIELSDILTSRTGGMSLLGAYFGLFSD